jgi:penicillin-binding protein 1C
MNLRDVVYQVMSAFVDLVVFIGQVVRSPIEKVLGVIKDIEIPRFRFPRIPKIKLDADSGVVIRFYKNMKKRLRRPEKKVKRKRKRKPKPKWVPRKKPKKEKLTFNQKYFMFVLGIFFATFFLFIPLEVLSWYKALPQPELLARINNRSTKILDRKGRLLYEIYIDKNYDPVALEQIPAHVKQATIAIEDDAFYSHIGFRPISILRAAKTTLLKGKLQGGSTITQQLVKNVLLNPERTISRKTKEIIVSLMVESTYTKGEILEMYLNNISYGGTAWGIQSASQKFFGKDIWELDLAEGSFLAGLPSAPSTYSPFGAGIDASKERQKQVLQRMVDIGYISKIDANKAYATELVFAPQTEYIRAPHFVNYVRNKLEEAYGKRLVNLGGLEVVTTLDLDLQGTVQNIVATEVQNNAFLNFSNGAAVVLDVKNGEILAYVGSVDFFSEEIDGEVDIITSYRQPGSSIKPITYALAFSSGYTLVSTIEDEKVTFNFPGTTSYTPKNYDGEYHGKVTLREALANSYNIPAVKLANALGPDRIVELGKKFGLTGWEVDGSYGISITLGGKEVRLLDHANVFATFSRGGIHEEVEPFLSITDANGYDIYFHEDKEEVVVSEAVAYLITHILSDNEARTPAFGVFSTLVIPGYQVAVKTGTTDEKRDNWTLGYTPSFAVGTWVGNNDNTPMHPYLSSGLSGASPMWNKIMRSLLEGYEPEPFIRPDNVFVKTDEECDNKSELFIRGTAPAHLCDLSEKDKDKGD